jgi:NADH-quinone oxidoreductase subunit N
MTDLSQLGFQLPLLVVIAAGAILLVVEAFAKSVSRRFMMHLGAFSILLALGACALVWKQLSDEPNGAKVLYGGMLVVDKFSLFASATFLVAGFLVTLVSADFFKEHAVLYGELYPLILFSISGMMILAMADDLTTIFLGVETMSIGAYVLTGSFRRQKRSSEAALKYFVTGAFATGFLLYGIALVYGATGTTSFAPGGEHTIQKALESSVSPIFIIGELMIIVAVAFKVSAVPFHMWAPDAYEGAPTPISGFMATAVKAAAFVGVLRLFLTAFGGTIVPFGHLGWTSILSALAVMTMTLGNLAALRQENIKRLLAYSSVSHAGYLLIGVVAAGIAPHGLDLARPAILYYLLAYTFTTVGAFGVVAWIGRRTDERLLVEDWNGLGARHPAAAFAMTIFMLSLGGFPPTAGFFGKFYVFRAAMEPDGQLTWLVVVGVVNSLISVYYYLRVIKAMYFADSSRELTPVRSPSTSLALAICATLVILMGVLPSTWLGLAKASRMLGLAP